MKEAKVIMPKINDGKGEAVLCSWLKDEGEAVKAGEPLFEIELDKVVMQIEAEHDGIVRKIVVDEGDEVAADEVVAIIDEK